jgi:arabinose-5-phosphate isomerase
VREVYIGLSRPGRRTGAVMLVGDDGCLTGLFTDSDLARQLEQRRDADLDRPIGDVMTKRPMTIGPTALLEEAVQLLSQRKLSELPVIDEQDRPIGLLDITDLIGLMPIEHGT